MANCSFIGAVEARNIARNNTLIWEEICGIQTQILGAIDGNLYSVIVNDGTPMTSTQSILSAVVVNGGSGYSILSATASINVNGTAGTGALLEPVVTGTTITGFQGIGGGGIVGGTGYTPVNVTAVVGNLYELNDAQDETDYTGGLPNGSFAGGDSYRVGEVISLSEGSTATVAAGGVSATGVVLTQGQTNTDFNGVGSNGTFVGGDGVGGTTYQTGTTITMSDGSVINVTSVDVNGDVDGFTIFTASVSKFTSLGTLSQVSTTSTGGVGFTITSNTNNEIAVGVVTLFDIASPGVTPFSWPSTVTQLTKSGIGSGFTIIPRSNNVAIVSTGINAALTVIQTSGTITNVVINSPGTGYLIGTPITFSHPNGSGATAIITALTPSNGIYAISVTAGGSSYQQAVATVTVTAPGGLTPALAFAGTVETATASSSNNYTSGLAFASGANTITRIDGTSFITDGFAVNQKIIVANAEDAANNGTYTINTISATVITTTEVITTTNASDTTATINHTAVVTGIIIIEGGVGYADRYPTIVISDSTGVGASLLVDGVSGGAISSIDLAAGGSGYTAPTLTYFNSNGTSHTITTEDITLTVGTNTFNTVPSDYYDVLVGQSTNPVYADQIQYILDYFTSLGYNIRAQTNSATADTIQWQIIW